MQRYSVIQDRGRKEYCKYPQMESDSNSKGEYVAVQLETDSLLKAEVDENKNDSSQDIFPLHYAAQSGEIDSLRELLKGGRDILQTDSNGRTPLHWAASGGEGNHKLAFKCVKELLASKQLGDDTEKIAYIDTPDKNGETAVHLAAKNECKEITEHLFVAGGSVTIKCNEGKEPKHLIMENIPEAMVRLCDTSIKYLSGELTDKNLKVSLAFGSIAGTMWRQSESGLREGINSDVKILPVESDFLKNALDQFDVSDKHCKDILKHPLVQIFIRRKFAKIAIFLLAAILFHLIWLILYTVFVVDVYLKSCPYITSEDNNSSGNSSGVERVLRHASGSGTSNNPSPPDSSEPQRTRFTWFGDLFSDVKDNAELTCDLNEVSMGTVYILLLITLVVAIQEVYEFSTAKKKCKDYLCQMENIGQWFLIASILLTSWPVFSLDNNMPKWQYSTAAFGIFIAWSLILSRIGGLPWFGHHVAMLLKVLKGFALFMMTFASLLIAFALSLSILFPGKPAFSSLPLALLKVLMMMVGELNYDEVFHGDEAITPFPVAAHIIFAIFAIMVTIILINLLIGTTVSDIRDLQDKADLSFWLATLEQIHFFESFVLSDKLCCCPLWWQTRLTITYPKDHHGMTVTYGIKEIPHMFEKDVRRLAALNKQEEAEDVVDPKKENLKNFLKANGHI